MEELASSLLATLKRSSAPVETKLSLLNSLKSSIKHQRIPESAQPATIECIRIAITAQTSATLVTAGFATLTHLIKRLMIQEEIDVLLTQRVNLLAMLLDKLGDLKEAHRQAASQALCDLWPAKQVEVEKLIRESAIQGDNARAKEAGIEWVTKMHALHSLQFRNFVGPIVECLEDADGSVRECAKTNILELFRDARDGAKADLKRQLLAYNVRVSITSHLLSQLGISTPAEASLNTSIKSLPRGAAPPQQDHALDASMLDNNNQPGSETAQLEPLYVQSQRELEDIFLQMQPCLEGREGDDNWKPRDANVTKLRRLLQGNAPNDHNQCFVAGIKTLLDGILKVANSLRTTMSTNGCALIQELAKALGHAIDSMVDTILQGLEKMSASTKHISGQNAYATIDTIFANVPYHARLMQHVWLASQDKNVQPRTFASGWLKTILKRQMQHKAQFEHSGGLELADKSIRKCLADANPKSRENMRSTFWLFAQAWPAKGEAIMASLDPKSKQLLEKDPSNPNAAHAVASFTTSVGPVSAPNPRAAPSAGRASLKDTIIAQKKAALAAKKMPERPNSAMSSFSPVKQAPPSAVRPAPVQTASYVRNQPTVEPQQPSRPPLVSAPSGSGLLSTGPMRRPRRPDMSRPATADLYASRKGERTDTPSRSPVVSPARSVASSVSSGQMGFAAINRPTVASQARAGLDADRTVVSPRLNPSRNGQRMPIPQNTATRPVSRPHAVTRADPGSPSPSPKEDNFTMVIPNRTVPTRQALSPRSRTDSSRGLQTRMSLTSMAEEDNFTLVMPRNALVEDLGSPRPSHAPLLSIAEGQTTVVLAEQIALPEAQISAVDFTGMSGIVMPQSQAAAGQIEAQSEDLIIFEDLTIENIVIPIDQIESSRTALEELHLNAQQVQLLPIQSVSIDLAPELDEFAVTKPTQKKSATTEQPLEDRAEVLKRRRNVKSNGGQQQHDTPNKASDPAHQSTDHDTATSQPLIEKITALILSSTSSEVRTPLQLEKTINNLISQLGSDTSSCLDHLSNYPWHNRLSNPTSRKVVLTTVLTTIRKLAAQITAAKTDLNQELRKQLTTLALHCLQDHDSAVRLAAVRFCVVLYAAFGREHHGEFWKGIAAAGESRLELVAYYLARSGLAQGLGESVTP